MILTILFLIVLIICRLNNDLKDFVYNNIYYKNISFSYFKNFYDNYLGGIFPFDYFDSGNVNSVFNEELCYDKLSYYEDGILLNVSYNYLVPVIREGIVVYIGNKDKYGNVVIIEDNDGIYTWYGNISNINVKLYDYLKNGTYLGEVLDNRLYLVFSNGNEFLDYSKYLYN